MSRFPTLYRIFGSNDELLYIGKSINGAMRINDHSKSKPWWIQVRKIDIEHFEDDESLLRAEEAAIRQERPKYNVQYNSQTSLSSYNKRDISNYLKLAEGVEAIKDKEVFDALFYKRVSLVVGIDEIAKILGIPEMFALRLVLAGEIPYFKVGRNTRVSIIEFRRFVQNFHNNTEEPTAAL